MKRKVEPRRKARLPIAAWSGLGLAALAASIELGVRLSVPMDALLYRDSADPALRFELIPGAGGLHHGVEVSISRQGLRDDEIPADKGPEEVRVVFVGDEHAFGRGVDVDKSIVRLLRDRLPDFKGRIRTVNLSVFRYNLQQKTELLCRRLAAFQPDFVVVQLSPDDLTPHPAPSVSAPGPKNALRRWSRAARFFAEKRWAKRPPARPGPPPPSPVNPLERLRDCLAGTPAALALLPDFERSPAGAADILRRAASEKGLPLWDLEVELGKPEYRHDSGPYINEAAHAAASNALAPLLNKALKARPKPGA